MRLFIRRLNGEEEEVKEVEEERGREEDEVGRGAAFSGKNDGLSFRQTEPEAS